MSDITRSAGYSCLDRSMFEAGGDDHISPSQINATPILPVSRITSKGKPTSASNAFDQKASGSSTHLVAALHQSLPQRRLTGRVRMPKCRSQIEITGRIWRSESEIFRQAHPSHAGKKHTPCPSRSQWVYQLQRRDQSKYRVHV